MRKRGYSIEEFVKVLDYKNLDALIHAQSEQFMRRFGTKFGTMTTVSLVFQSSYDATEFYQEVKFSPDYKAMYDVTLHPYKKHCVVVTGQATLFDYFGSNEPNLLTVSRDLKIRFTIDFVQDYTGTAFKGEVVNGELLARQCIVEVSSILPELTLGGLGQIANTLEEFDLLLTRFYPVKAEVI